MDKQEIIKKAYGEYWDKVKDHVGKETGSLDVHWWVINELNLPFDRIGFGDRRPKSLSGIENNNGWTKIESEKDLPKIANRYYVKDKFREDYYIAVFEEALKEKWLEIITHYRPIEKPKPPIF